MSNETKWTPGPWSPMPCYDHMAQGVEAEGRDIVLWRGMARPRSTESIANVRLIAAAPELYEALDELDRMYSHAWDTTTGELVFSKESVKKFEAAHEKAVAAMYKARGKA